MDLLHESNRLAGELAHGLRRSLFEEKGQKRIIAVYSGRFQPFHAGHASVYKALVDKFGKDNVYIATSNKTELPRSPMNFQEKKELITTMFDIDTSKIQEVKNNYNPQEILTHFNPDTTAYVSAVSEKDADRLKTGKYFKHYIDDQPLSGYKDAGYYIVAPELANEDDGPISGTKIRQVFGSDRVPFNKKKDIFQKMYGKDNDNILNMLIQKSTEAEKALDHDGPDKTKATKSNVPIKSTPLDATDATSKNQKAPPAEDDKKSNKSPMDRTIINPDTGREIQVKSALKYPRWKPVYKHAERSLKSAGIDRPDRVKEPEVNARYKKRAKKQTKEEMTLDLGGFLSEVLLGKTWAVISNRIQNNLILEAAPKSHIEHPYDDPNMTFGELRGIIRSAMTGDLGGDATEKTDGQNIMFTVKDGQVRFARNTQHTKNGGQNAMSAQEFGDFFNEHGAVVSDSFRAAAKDVENAIKFMPPEEISRVFKDGENFAMGEILNKDLPNTIPYNSNQIMLLSVRKFDPTSGNPTEIDKDAADRLARDIESHGGGSGSKYKIVGKNVIHFNTTDEDRKLEAKYLAEVDKLGVSDNETLATFLGKQWAVLLDKSDVQWTPEERAGLMARWVLGDKSFNIRGITDPTKRAAFKEIDDNYKTEQANIIRPLKTLMLNVGADAMSRVSNFVAGDDGTKQKLKEKLLTSIDAIKKSGNEEYITKMKKELEQLSAVGIDKIAPSEGLVFTYKGRLMKFTGAFAPLNQIIGIYTYKLNPAKRKPDTADDLQPTPAKTDATTKTPDRELTPRSDEPTPKKQETDPTMLSPHIKKKLNQRINNPDTGNKILVKTALGYDKDHPAYKAAHALMAEAVLVEALLDEGGNQFDQVNSVIPRQHADSVVTNGLRSAGIDLPHSIVGNKNKELLGDLDVAIDKSDMEKFAGAAYGTPDFYSRIQQKLGKMPNKVQAGLNQFSILVPLLDNDGKPMNAVDQSGTSRNEPGYVQVDVFVGNRAWMEKFQSGAGEGSAHKAVARNMVPIAAFSKISFPTDQEGVRRKYQIDNKNGVESITYRMENGKRVRLSKELVTSNPDDLAHILFGKDVSWDDVDTFEKMYQHFTGPMFQFKDQRTEIAATIKQSIISTKQIPPSELDMNIVDEPNNASVPQHDPSTRKPQNIDDKTIKNPETGNDILVKSALKYPPEHPVHKAALKFINKSRQ